MIHLAQPRVVADGSQLRVDGMLTLAEYQALERLRNSRFFLVRNDGGQIGERAVCRQCGLLHSYLTYMCVERPYRGLEEGLWACIRVATDDAKRSRLLSAFSKLPDFGTAHPMSARDLTPDSSGEIWYSLLIGGPEPIDDTTALRLAQRINDRRPPIPFVL